jgi:FtsH-binding integral membrane protein
MRKIESILNGKGFGMGNMNISTLLKMNELSEETRQMLLKTYILLLASILTAAFGSFIHIIFNIGGGLSILMTFVLLLCIVCQNDKSNIYLRSGLLLCLAFFQGISIGPLISVGINISPHLILLALLCTSAIFGGFSLGALVAKRRSYLFLAGFLSSAIMILAITGIVNLFVHSLQLYLVQLYAGLIVFSGFVIFDTQMIVEVSL